MILRRPEDVGLLVRDRRRAAGWSQAVLAARVGSSRQWVVELERGNGGAELGRVLRLLAALGVSLDALVTAPEPPGSRGGTDEGTDPPASSRPREWSSGALALPSPDEVLGERPPDPPRGDAPGAHGTNAPPASGASGNRPGSKRATRKAT